MTTATQTPATTPADPDDGLCPACHRHPCTRACIESVPAFAADLDAGGEWYEQPGRDE